MRINDENINPTPDNSNQNTSDNSNQNTSDNSTQNIANDSSQNTPDVSTPNIPNQRLIKPFLFDITKVSQPLYIPSEDRKPPEWIPDDWESTNGLFGFEYQSKNTHHTNSSDIDNVHSDALNDNSTTKAATLDTKDNNILNTPSHNSTPTSEAQNNNSDTIAIQNTSNEKVNVQQSLSKNQAIFPVNFSSVIHSIGNYVYKDGELLYLEPESQKEFLIGNIWVTIKKEISYMSEIANEHNEIIRYEPHTRWLIDIECMQQHFLNEVTVGELFDSNKLLKLTSDRAYMETTAESKRCFKKYINFLISQQGIHRETLFNSTGWKKTENGWFYLTDLGIVGINNSLYKANVDYHFNYTPEHVDTPQTFSVFHAMRNLSEKKIENTVFLMHYSCLSVMTTLFQEVGHGINFVVALIGTTNSQKTATANIFTRLYNRTAKSSADIRFDSTRAAILEKTSSYGDSILMIDDILPYDDPTKMKQQNSVVTEIVRAYGDRVPRMRSEAYAKINDVPQYSAIKGCCLITGELLDIGFESTATRIMRLDFERGDINLDKLTFYQNNLMNLPTFMYGYIRFITENIDRIFSTIEHMFNTTRKRKFPANMAARYIDTLAIMCTEITIFYTYAVEKKFLSQNAATTCQAFDIQCIEKIITKNYLDAQIHTPAATILLALKRAIDKHTIGYYQLHNKLTKNAIDNSVLYDDSFIYVRSAVLWELYKNYCYEMRRSVTYKSERELAKPLAKENAILQKEENGSLRSTHKITAITSSRFFMIRKDVFEKYCGSFEDF